MASLGLNMSWTDDKKHLFANRNPIIFVCKHKQDATHQDYVYGSEG
jgi:hypothetical protein